MADGQLKIVFVTTGLSTGGAEMMLLKLLERIDRTRFLPYVISLTSHGEVGPRIQALGFPAETLDMSARVPNPLTLLRLIQRLRALKPDIVHTWMYHADLLGGLAAWLAGRRAVAWGIHNSNLDADKTKRSTRMVVWACARLSSWLPRKIFCCSEEARRAHVARGYRADAMVVVPNGFDLARFRPDPMAGSALLAELGLASDARLVGLIGRFDVQKNHAGFFTAAGLLQRRLDRVHFVLAGSGIEASNTSLVRMIEAAGVRSVTHLLGLRNDIPRIMAALDVLVSSSHGEAFPNVLGEAMACGVPCVATDVGDSAYIIGDAGRVVAPGDMPGLADAVEKILLLTSPERTDLSHRARARIAANFEIGQVARRYESLYEDLAAVGTRSCA